MELIVICIVYYIDGSTEKVEVEINVLAGSPFAESVKDYVRNNRNGVRDVVIIDVGTVIDRKQS